MKALLIILLEFLCVVTYSQNSQVCQENLHDKQEQFYELHPDLLSSNSYNMREVLDRIKKTAINQESIVKKDTADERRLDNFLVNLISDSAKTKFEDPYVLWLLTYLKQYLESSLNKVPAYKKKNICLGSLPSTEPNAYTESIDENTYLLIFNRHLFLYINELLKLGLTAIEKTPTKNGVSFKLDSFDVAKRKIEKNKFLLDRMQELMDAFVKLKPLPERNFRIAKDYEIFQYALLIGTERFIMCHEIAHALLDHKESNTVMDLWGRELSADVIGYKLYANASLQSKDTIDIVFRNILLSVPLFYFQITDIFTEASNIIRHSADSLTSAEKTILLQHIKPYAGGIIKIEGSPETFKNIEKKLKYPDGITRSAILIALFADYMYQPDISVIAERNISIIWNKIKPSFESSK